MIIGINCGNEYILNTMENRYELNTIFASKA